MEISITVPDDVARQLSECWENLPRPRPGGVGGRRRPSRRAERGQVRRLLDLPTCLDVDAFLKRAGAYLCYGDSDLEQDVRTLEELPGS